MCCRPPSILFTKFSSSGKDAPAKIFWFDKLRNFPTGIGTNRIITPDAEMELGVVTTSDTLECDVVIDSALGKV